MKKSIKQFLKPNWKKILVFVLLAIILSLPKYKDPYPPMMVSRPDLQGLPLPIIISEREFGEDIAVLPFIIINIIIWYLFASLIVWIYDKFKKKS